MSRKWVVNSSPVISLAKISHIELLGELTGELVIPSAVSKEILAGEPGDPARKWIEREDHSQLVSSISINPNVASWDLGLGESEVISYAIHQKGFEAIFDDRAARNCAISFGIPCRGTLGIILLAKREQKISKASPLFDRLIEAGLHIDPELLKTVVKLAQED